MLTTTRVADIADPDPRSIAIGPFGSSLKADLYESSGVPVVRGQNIGADPQVDESDLVFVSPETANKMPACIVHEGDLVFPHRGAIGRVAMVGKRSMLLSSSMMKLSCDRTKVDPRFILYYFRGPGKDELLTRASTVGTPGIGQPLTSLRGIPLKLPTLAQQRAIAEVLGALDDKIAANTRLADAANALASHIYDASVVGLSETTMSETLEPVLGGTPARANSDFWGGDRLWASAKDVTAAPFSVITDSAEKITQLAVDQTKVKPLPIGSVILTARGTVGAVARLGAPSSLNQSCYGFAPGVLPPGILYFSILRAAQRAKAIAHGSVFDTITMRTFDHLRIPDFGEEVNQIETKVGLLLDRVTGSVNENAALTAARDALLPQLMAGKLRVEDAEALVEAVV